LPLVTDTSGYKIVINSVLVSQSYAYGYVGDESVVFSMDQAEPGYQVILVHNGTNDWVTYCNKKGLKKHLELLRYKISLRDSVANLPPTTIHQQKPQTP